MKFVVSDACRICKNLNKEASSEDTPICSLININDEIETDGTCTQLEEEDN